MKFAFATHEQYSLQTNELVVIDRQYLTSSTCTPDTVLLVYTPPKRLANYLEQSEAAFDTSCCTPIPILPPLAEWVNNLLSLRLEDAKNSQLLCLSQRQRLARILLNYPRKLIGELYMPFRACSMGDCALCLAQITSEE